MMIAEAAAFCGITPASIRYYERLGFLQIARDKNGIRNFGVAAISRLQLIKSLKRLGLSIKSIQRYLELEDDGCKDAQQELLLAEYHQQTQEIEALKIKRARLQAIAEAEAAFSLPANGELADAS